MRSQPTSPFLCALERRRFLQLCAGSLALGASGCGRRKDHAYARGSTVIVGVPEQEAAVDPTPGPSQSSWLAFLPLLAFNDKGELEGRLAERWEHSPDYREWTYYIRSGIRWHDGHPVTAHDVKFSLELLTSPDVLEFAPDAIESVVVLDDYTVRVRHRTRMWNNYQWEEMQYPKHLLEHLDTKQFWKWEFWKRPVGNGPYRFVRSVPQTMMEFEVNPDYYGRKPKIERVISKSVGQGGLSDLLSGNVDAITFVNPAWIPTLAADARFLLYYSIDYPSYAAIFWQHRDPLFRDARVRRALTLAINRRELLQLLHLPQDAPLADGPVTRRQLRRGQLDQPLPYDPAQARALLEAAGWHDRTGGGIREREGLPFRFTVLVPSAPPNYQQMAIYVQAQLRRIGVDMALQIKDDFRSIREKLKMGDFQAAFFSDSALFLRWGLNGPNVTRTQGLGYLNAKVVELVNRATVTADPDEEDRIYTELRKIFREDVPATYLIPFMRASVAHRRIRGLSAPWRTHPFPLMDALSADGSGS